MERKQNPRREELKKLSASLIDKKKAGAIATINEGLKQLYEQQGLTELKTLRQWNEIGKRIKSGEKALLLWGMPKRKQIERETPAGQEPPKDTDENMFDFFPLCYVFDKSQTC